jgi:signal transduction histidine kinase
MLNRHFYKGIRFKITLVFSVVFLLINIVLSSFTYRYFKNAYLNNYNKYLFNRAKTILSRTEINPDLIALPDSGESIRVFYHDNSGRPVSVFQSPGTIARVQAPYQLGVTDTLGQHGVYMKRENYDGRPVEILLTVPNKYITARLRHLSLMLLFTTLASVLAGSVASYFASMWLLKPIRNLARQAADINTNRLDKRLSVRSTHDELQQLGETINNMLSRIAHEQEIQNNFFAAASHELRTPLSILQAETELRLNNISAVAERALYESQLTEIKRLQQVVEQFLLVSQLKHKGLVLNSRPTDLSDQLMSVFARNTQLAQTRQTKTILNFSNDVSSFQLNADADKLDVVWQNLLQNAIKHSPKGTAVNCDVLPIANGLKVVFKNLVAGQFVPVDDLTDAFTTNRSVTSGSGLGLWLCRQVVEAHGGNLQLSFDEGIFVAEVSLPLA